MDKNFFDELANNAAEASSRRRFFGKVGKVTIGIAGLLIGERLTIPSVGAASIYCCHGAGACVNPPGQSCPNGYTAGYYWYCCDTSDRYYYVCLDCTNHSTGQLCITPARYRYGCA